MKKYKVSIPQPCKEDWEKMTITDQGRHCASCDKVVMDFTHKSSDEIITELLKAKGKKVCGNFLNTQIERPLLQYVPMKAKKWAWPSVAALIMAGLFQIMPNNLSAQNPTTLKRYPSTIHQFKGGHLPQQNIEVKKDSTYSCQVSVFEQGTKNPVMNAMIDIKGVGTFYTDENGIANITSEYNKIPDSLEIQLDAHGYAKKVFVLSFKPFSKKSEITWYLEPREEYMLRGDVTIEEY